MIRRLLLTALAAASLTLPAPVLAQSSDTGGSAEAEIFMSALEYIQRMHMQTYSDSTLWTRALDGLVEDLGDPYAAVFTPVEVEEFQEETTGNYGGIGVSISQLNDQVTITTVFRGTPAARAELMVGDVIVGVNEHDASGWTTTMASDSIRGPAGSSVEVHIRRGGQRQPIQFTLTRDSVHVAAVQSGRLPGDIGLIVLDRVARNSSDELMAALDSLADTRGIILDLRGNPGGYLDESLVMADMFLGRGKVLATTRNRDARNPSLMEEESFRGRMRPRVPDKPIIVLVNEYTASAAEIVTGALQDFDRALVLGERTFGKGIVQSVVDLPYGRKLRITTGSWHTPLGRSLHRERDAGGTLAPENLDTIATVATPTGRELKAGGGIFPDLEIKQVSADSIVLRELNTAVNEKQIQLGLREAEVSFRRAQTLRETRQPPSVDDATFDAYMKGLADAGLPAELVAEPEIRSFLRWRLQASVADRLENFAAAQVVRMERDAVLSKAVELMRNATTQQDLFTGAARAKAEATANGGRAGDQR